MAGSKWERRSPRGARPEAILPYDSTPCSDPGSDGFILAIHLAAIGEGE